jgi:hypothetical protein
LKETEDLRPGGRGTARGSRAPPSCTTGGPRNFEEDCDLQAAPTVLRIKLSSPGAAGDEAGAFSSWCHPAPRYESEADKNEDPGARRRANLLPGRLPAESAR